MIYFWSILAGLLVVGVASELFLRWRTRRNEVARKERENESYGKAYAAPYFDFFGRADFRYIRLYTMNPSRATAPEYSFDSWGFRTDSCGVRFGEERPGTKIIWFFGNSTAQGLGNRENETIPALLNARFAGESSPWRVVNAGMGGFASIQSLLLMIEMLHARSQVDAMVFYNGLREYARPRPSNMPPRSWFEWQRGTEITGWLREFEAGEASFARHVLQYMLRRYIMPRALMASATRNSLRAARLAARLGVPGAARTQALLEPVYARSTPTSPMGKSALQEWMVDRYMRNTRIIQGIAAALDIPCLHFHQPLLSFDAHYDVRKLSADEAEMRLDTMDVDRRELIYSEAFARARASIAAGWIDLWDVFAGYDGRQLFSGPRHTNAEGNRIVADVIYDHLVKRGIVSASTRELYADKVP